MSCNGLSDGSIDVTVTGATGTYTTIWDTGETTEDLSGLSAGTYTLTVEDENECAITIPVEITETQPMEILSTQASDYNGYGISCYDVEDGFINVDVDGGTSVYTYTWNTGQTTQNLENIGPGTYSLTIADENGCAITTEDFILQPVDDITITGIISEYTG